MTTTTGEPMSPQELIDKRIATAHQWFPMNPLAPRFRVKELTQTYEQFKAKGDMFELLGFDYSDEGVARFKEWCAKHRVHFYAAPSDEFSRVTGICEAEEAKADWVLMENLS